MLNCSRFSLSCGLVLLLSLAVSVLGSPALQDKITRSDLTDSDSPLQLSLSALPNLVFNVYNQDTTFSISVVDVTNNNTILQTTSSSTAPSLGAGVWKGIYQNFYSGYMLRLGYVSESYYAGTWESYQRSPDGQTLILTYAAVRSNDSEVQPWTFQVSISAVQPIASTSNSFQINTVIDMPFVSSVKTLNWVFPFITQTYQTKDTASQQPIVPGSNEIPVLSPTHSLFDNTFATRNEFEIALASLEAALQGFESNSREQSEAAQNWNLALRMGEILLRDGQMNPSGEAYIPMQTLSELEDNNSTVDAASPDSYEQFFGFGMRWGFDSYRGEKFYSFSEDGSWSFLNMSYRLPKPNATYIPMPLFYSRYPVGSGEVRDSSVWINTTYRCNFVMGSLKPSEIADRRANGLVVNDAWTVTTEYNSTTTIFVFPFASQAASNDLSADISDLTDESIMTAADPFSRFTVAAKRLKAIKRAQGNDVTYLPSFLTMMSLRTPPLIPSPYIFGVWKQTGNVLPNTSETEIIQMMQKQDIPISLRIGALHFFPGGDQQGHESEIIAENEAYHSLGVKTICYFNAMCETNYESVFEPAAQQGFFLRNSSGLPYLFPYFGDIISRHFYVAQFDYANQQANTYYQNAIAQSVSLGFDGFMYDFGEYVQIDSYDVNGLDGQGNHHAWIELYQKCAYDFNQVDDSAAMERERSIRNLRSKFVKNSKLESHHKRQLKQRPTALTSMEVLQLYPSNAFSSITAEELRQRVAAHYTADLAIYTRSGYTHSSQYGSLHWTGDASADWNIWSGLPGQLAAAIGIGVSGVAFSSSPIGGYVCELYPDLTPELMIRWVEVGAFSGFMHDETEGSACTANRAQLFSTKDTVFGWRKWGKFRTQMFPYIYTAAHQATTNTLPIQRHHILMFPNDPVASDQEYQFMFGDDFLAAPVVFKSQETQAVYLPLGAEWINVGAAWQYDGGQTDPNLNTGRFRIGYAPIQTGGQTVTVSATLHETPLFVRAGSIIPLLDPSVNSLAPSTGTTAHRHGTKTVFDMSSVQHIWVFPDSQGDAAGMSYDGTTMIYVTPSTAYANLTLSGSSENVFIVQVPIPSTTAVQSVLFTSGSAFQEVTSWQQVAQVSPLPTQSVWTYDKQQQVVWMAVVPSSSESQITIQF